MAIMFAGWTCPVAGVLLSTMPFSAIPAPKLTVDGTSRFHAWKIRKVHPLPCLSSLPSVSPHSQLASQAVVHHTAAYLLFTPEINPLDPPQRSFT